MRDGNERAIVDALRAAGHLVQPLNQGAGVPDLLVGVSGPVTLGLTIVLLEVKDPTQPKHRQRLTPDQERWHQQWARAPIHVVNSVEQALDAVEKYL